MALLAFVKEGGRGEDVDAVASGGTGGDGGSAADVGINVGADGAILGGVATLAAVGNGCSGEVAGNDPSQMLSKKLEMNGDRSSERGDAKLCTGDVARQNDIGNEDDPFENVDTVDNSGFYSDDGEGESQIKAGQAIAARGAYTVSVFDTDCPNGGNTGENDEEENDEEENDEEENDEEDGDDEDDDVSEQDSAVYTPNMCDAHDFQKVKVAKFCQVKRNDCGDTAGLCCCHPVSPPTNLMLPHLPPLSFPFVFPSSSTPSAPPSPVSALHGHGCVHHRTHIHQLPPPQYYSSGSFSHHVPTHPQYYQQGPHAAQHPFLAYYHYHQPKTEDSVYVKESTSRKKDGAGRVKDLATKKVGNIKKLDDQVKAVMATSLFTEASANDRPSSSPSPTSLPPLSASLHALSCPALAKLPPPYASSSASQSPSVKVSHEENSLASHDHFISSEDMHSIVKEGIKKGAAGTNVVDLGEMHRNMDTDSFLDEMGTKVKNVGASKATHSKKKVGTPANCPSSLRDYGKIQEIHYHYHSHFHHYHHMPYRRRHYSGKQSLRDRGIYEYDQAFSDGDLGINHDSVASKKIYQKKKKKGVKKHYADSSGYNDEITCSSKHGGTLCEKHGKIPSRKAKEVDIGTDGSNEREANEYDERSTTSTSHSSDEYPGKNGFHNQNRHQKCEDCCRATPNQLHQLCQETDECGVVLNSIQNSGSDDSDEKKTAASSSASSSTSLTSESVSANSQLSASSMSSSPSVVSLKGASDDSIDEEGERRSAIEEFPDTSVVDRDDVVYPDDNDSGIRDVIERLLSPGSSMSSKSMASSISASEVPPSTTQSQALSSTETANSKSHPTWMDIVKRGQQYSMMETDEEKRRQYQNFVNKIRKNRIGCLGAGYVGASTMAFIADTCPDVDVVVMDMNKDRVDQWMGRKGDDLPIFEPGLKEVVLRRRGKNLFFTEDLKKGIEDSDIIFVAVNTPTKQAGEGAGQATDLSSWESAGRSIAEYSLSPKIIVEKSTIPVHTAETLAKLLLSNSRQGVSFSVLSNPEFLAEGTALKDLTRPDRVLIGGSISTAIGCFSIGVLAELFGRWVEVDRIITTNIWSAELSKLAANAFLAQRVSSINAIAQICEKCNADVREVSRVVGSDRRIGNLFLEAGVGFGGSCFQKDILSLIYLCYSNGLSEVAKYWEQVILMNNLQKITFSKKIINALFSSTRNKKLAVFGFTFKKDTGDTRATPALDVCLSLLLDGATLSLFDPKAKFSMAVEELRSHRDFLIKQTNVSVLSSQLSSQLTSQLTSQLSSHMSSQLSSLSSPYPLSLPSPYQALPSSAYQSSLPPQSDQQRQHTPQTMEVTDFSSNFFEAVREDLDGEIASRGRKRKSVGEGQ